MTTVLTARRGPVHGRRCLRADARLFPLCRSLTAGRAGDVRRARGHPDHATEIPSGTQVFDWIVPDEWNIRDAYVAAPDGTRVVDFRRSTLHVVCYSEPVRATLPLEQLPSGCTRCPTSRT